MSDVPNERRNAKRVRADLPVSMAAPDGGLGARVYDLSRNGLRCLMANPIPEMTKVKLELEIPLDGAPAKVNGEGAVVRCEQSANEDYEVAILFTELDKDGSAAITRYISATS